MAATMFLIKVNGGTLLTMGNEDKACEMYERTKEIYDTEEVTFERVECEMVGAVNHLGNPIK